MVQRAVKRVDLNFQWPLYEVWEGYVNPYTGPITCVQCKGSGYNSATKQIAYDFFHSNDNDCGWHDKITQDEVQALVDAGRLFEFTHTFSKTEGWVRRNDGYIPTAEEVNAYQHRSIGHDCINRSILIITRAKRLDVLGDCPVCHGEGTLPLDIEVEKLHNEWKCYKPPAGDGFQLWEMRDEDEGYPISPVFASADELATWCAENIKI